MRPAGPRGPYRPLELRARLYEEVLRLRKQGLGCKRILKEIERIYGNMLSRATISHWIQGVHIPYRSVKTPILKPSKELAYIVGTMFGDGSTSMIKSYNRREYRITLSVRDREFAEKTAECLGVALNRPPPRTSLRKDGRYYVSVRNKTLFDLLHGRDPEKIKPFVEHCDECKAAFLRGFFDSEGTITEDGVLNAFNSNLELIKYVARLLAELGIETTGPYLSKRKGLPMKCPKTGKVYEKKKDIYILHVKKKSIPTSYQKIGFTIKRKQKRLEEYLKRIRLLPI